MRKINRSIICIGLGFLLCLNFLVWQQVLALNNSAELKVDFLDVGQGDSVLIGTPLNQQILIDGGPSSKILEELSKAMPFFDRSIDMIILTHPDPDHLNGVVDVLKSYKVGLVAFNGAEGTDPAFAEFKQLIADKKIPTVILYQGKRVKIAENLYFNIYWPEESLEGMKVSDFNTSSIVSQLVYKDIKYLFTGDISKSVENKLIDSGENIDSDILKVAHHGSKTSTSEEFLKAVFPKVAVISVGADNKYGHPTQEVLENLENNDVECLRTDQLGDIKIVSDGKWFFSK